MPYFGFEDLHEKLVGNGIHTLENVIPLDYSFAYYFETLWVWFEAIVIGLRIFTARTEVLQGDQGNTYAVRAGLQALLRSCRDNPITLTSQYPDLPLPNRTFLAIHAACCRTAHLSGAFDYIKKTLDNMEEVGYLTSRSH
jgi:hypothetical protein